MKLDISRFYQATNPSKTLAIENEEDRKFYIDFSSVRGGAIIQEIKRKIINPFKEVPDESSCQLFTGHIGCGKSTELLRLKKELQDEKFHVVYFVSDEDLEFSDVDVGDVLLTIARHVDESLQAKKINLQPTGFKKLLQDVGKVLNADVLGITLKPPKMAEVELGDIGYKTRGDEFSISFAIGEIIAQTKASPTLREKLRGFLEPRTKQLIDAINNELLRPAIAKLKQAHHKGLVVIVDNLEKIDISPKPSGRFQPEYLFIDRGSQLRGLHCHIIYTIPLSLRFCNEFNVLSQRFMGELPWVLDMVAVQSRDRTEHSEGMALLREMLIARAFPGLDLEQRRLEAQQPRQSPHIYTIVESVDDLDRLCLVSGGHIRVLLNLLNDWIGKDQRLPLTRPTLESLIKMRRNHSALSITPDEWALLHHVTETQSVFGDGGYQSLIRGMYVYEYQDLEGFWFDIDPILRGAKEFRA